MSGVMSFVKETKMEERDWKRGSEGEREGESKARQGINSCLDTHKGVEVLEGFLQSRYQE